MAAADLLTHPALVSGIVPGMVAGAVSAALGASGVARYSLAFGTVCGSAVSLWLLFGAPSFPARSALDKLPMLVPLGGALLVLSLRLGRRLRTVAGAGLVMVAAVWLALPQLSSTPVVVALVLLAGLVAYLPSQARFAVRVPSRLVLGAGLCAVAFAAGSLVLAQSALATTIAIFGSVVGATLGAMLAGKSARSVPEAAIADELFTILGPLLVVALMILLLTEVVPWSMIPLVLVLPMLELAQRLPGGERALGVTLWQAFLCALPLALTLVLVLLGAPEDDAYYR